MIRILIVLFILVPMPLMAQNSLWVKPNAVWHYDYSTIGWFGFMKIEHSGDTVIQGKNAMHFILTDYAFTYNQQGQTVTYGVFPAGDFYTYAEGDTVFYRQDSSFQKLFDFSKSTGDSYLIGVTNPSPAEQCSMESWTMLTATGTDVYAYPSISVEAYLNANLKLTGTFNHRFGGDYFLPLLRPCDPSIIYEDYIFTFRCFQDDSLVVNPNGLECEYMLTHVGLNAVEEHTLYIGPNPTSGNLAIRSDVRLSRIELFTLAGIRVQTQDVHSSSCILEMSMFEPGIYVMHVYDEDGGYFTGRIVLD
jgi:hypothetical protein